MGQLRRLARRVQSDLRRRLVLRLRGGSKAPGGAGAAAGGGVDSFLLFNGEGVTGLHLGLI